MSQIHQPWYANPEWDDDGVENAYVEDETLRENEHDEAPLVGFTIYSNRKSYTEPDILLDRILDYGRARVRGD